MLSATALLDIYNSLLDASWRGVTFSVIDARHEVGRRAMRFLFPGSDLTVFQDYGAFDGPIHIAGLISGDNYIYDAWKLHTAFRTAGPGTLVHPWLGEIEAVLAKPAKISFKDQEGRIVRFEAEFLPYDSLIAPPPDTLQSVLDAIDDAIASAKAWLHDILAPVAMALAAFSYAQTFFNKAVGWFDALTGNVEVIGPAATSSISALQGTAAATYSDTWADTSSTALVAVPAAIAAAAETTPTAAVGPGDSATTADAADPAEAANVLLAAQTKFASLASDPSPGPNLAAAMQAVCAVEAVRAASDISFDSQQAAIAWRDTILAGIDSAAAVVASAAATDPVTGGALWRALMTLRGAWLADMTATIGRLPAVVTLTLPAPTSIWVVANARAGDDPTAVLASYDDIVTRNAVANPAAPGTRTLEVLNG